eukprot:g427.t1
MKLLFVAFTLCFLCTSALPLSQKHIAKWKLRLNKTVYSSPAAVSPGETPIASTDPGNSPDDCFIGPSEEARSREGRLRVIRGTEDEETCCELCRSVPESGCRSWYRAPDGDQRCFLNSNP